MSNLARRLTKLEEIAAALPTCPDPWHSRPYVDWPDQYLDIASRYVPDAPPQPRQCPTCGSDPDLIIEVRYVASWPDGDIIENSSRQDMEDER